VLDLLQLIAPFLGLSPASSGKGGSGSGIGAVLFNQSLGAPAAVLDTGANGIAGTQNALLVFILARTDEVVVPSPLNITFNNDVASAYDAFRVGSTAGGAPAGGANHTQPHQVSVPGASAGANVFGPVVLLIPSYTNATAHKSGFSFAGIPDPTTANMDNNTRIFHYGATGAITRIAIAPATAAKNLVAGTQMTVIGL
jgi:hypothetical protein